MIGRSADQYKDGAFTWFTGKVENINDPKKLNRVKVRCFGFYDDIAVADLPWATVMMPVTSASTKGNGGNHHLEVGSWVVGFFRDGPKCSRPDGDGFNRNSNRQYTRYTNRIISR